MGPIATAMGEIYQYTLQGPMPNEPEARKRYLTDLRTVQEWVVTRNRCRWRIGDINTSDLGRAARTLPVVRKQGRGY